MKTNAHRPDGNGYGCGNINGSSRGDGYGFGCGHKYGSGDGRGTGYSDGDGYGYGDGDGFGDGGGDGGSTTFAGVLFCTDTAHLGARAVNLIIRMQPP